MVVPRDLRRGIGAQTQYDLRHPAFDAVLRLVHFTQELRDDSWQTHVAEDFKMSTKVLQFTAQSTRNFTDGQIS